jgi:hypothetical protein
MTALMASAGTAAASSHNPTGEFVQFAECPMNRVTITDCIYSVTEKGSFTLGNKTVPIENPVTLQGGFEGEVPNIKFYGAENGDTLSKTPQPVPGGLLGLLNCKAQTNPLIKGLCETALENGLTGVNATVELTGPSKGLTNVKLNTENLIFREGTALELPGKIKLENPLLGGNCYIGSDKSPLVISLTTGTSGALSGSAGTLTFNGDFSIITIAGSRLVNNTFAAPAASGCGGLLSLLVDPVLNAVIGLPAASGKNSATLEGLLKDSQPEYVKASE